jgi:D-3-phosphoglycerate dehydrogenase / 2-oxoglutarate reductase
MTTIYIPDPVDSLMPFAEERAVAEAAGAELAIGDRDNPAIRDAEVILTTWIRFPPEVLPTLERCRLIVRYGIGVDTIDLAAATKCGIVVSNAPTYCVAEVADHAAGLILSLSRRIPWLDRQVRAGGWAAAQQETWGVRRMSTLTLGIVGLGTIGRQVRALGAEPAGIDDLMRESDVVSLHVPLMPQTRHLIDESRLGLMKPSAAIANTSRGPVIDEAALVRALQDGRIFGAALDVLEQEPPAPDNPLLRLDPQRVIMTPHFAASSEEVHPDLHREVSAAAAAVLDGRWPASVMNPDVVPKVPLRR